MKTNMNTNYTKVINSKEDLYNEFLNEYSKDILKMLSVQNYAFHKKIFHISLHGIGILNYQNYDVTGEKFFIINCLKKINKPIILDVGSNIGEYASLVKENHPNSLIFAFEPHPESFKKLKEKSQQVGFYPFNYGFSDCEKVSYIYDYSENNGSSHASLYKSVIEDNFKKKSTPNKILLKTIDSFIEEYNIDNVDLLKIDTEGHELNVLKGAEYSIKKGIFNIIHFEFNEMNVYSKTFFKDITKKLYDYYFFRMLPDGLAYLGEYTPLTYEIFAFQNVVAVNKHSKIINNFTIC